MTTPAAQVPFLRVERLGLVKCRTLAKLLKLPTYAGFGIGLALWDYGLDVAPIRDDGMPDLRGHLVGDAAELLAAVLEYEGEPARLWAVLCQVGLCEATKGKTPARIKGLKRYLSVFSERKKERDRWKRRKHSGQTPAEYRRSPAQLRPQEEDLDQDQDLLKEEGPALPITSVASPAAPSSVGFFPWMRSTRVKRHPHLSEERPPPQVTLDRLDDAVRQVGRAELEQRYLTYLEVEYWSDGKPPWHANGFAKNWPQCPPAPKQLAIAEVPQAPRRSELGDPGACDAYRTVLEQLRVEGNAYAVSQLQQLRPELRDGHLHLVAADKFFCSWVVDHYTKLVTAKSPVPVLFTAEEPH